MKASTIAQVVKAAQEKNLQILDHGNALWLICPVAKVFDLGDVQAHCQFFEYGRQRSEFMAKALDSEHWHAMVIPEFFPSSKTEAYRPIGRRRNGWTNMD